MLTPKELETLADRVASASYYYTFGDVLEDVDKHDLAESLRLLANTMRAVTAIVKMQNGED